jgi:toxin-antitoxin system PIN domain toxin
VSGPVLLDVNVLVALFHPDHVHHDLAHDWFAENRSSGWATTPLTENGFVRVLSHPKSGVNERPARLLEHLAKFCTSSHHVFWPDAISLRDDRLLARSYLVGPKQITDLYLLALAKKMGGRLATFDRSIPVGAVVGATRATLAVISPETDADRR